MPYSFYLSSELSNLATTLASASNSSDIYISKSANGVVSASVVERQNTVNNFGYPFQFIDGSVSYTALPITNINQIPWTFTYSSLTASSFNLWNNSLMMWIDSYEPKSISVSSQRVVSKDYSNNVIVVENTTNDSFLYTQPSLSLTGYSSLESYVSQTVYAYFKLGLVFTLPTQTLNTVLFQHNRLKIKLTSQTAPDGSTQSMIGIFDNDVFKRGITLKPNDLTFKYQLFTDNLGNLIISNNTSAFGNSPSYYQATSAKIYIGSDSTKTYPANMILHELLLYESVANDIVATSENISSYFTTRHSLTTYNDIYNAYPYSWTGLYSKGNRTSIITITSGMTLTNGPATCMINGQHSGGGADVSDRVSCYPVGIAPYYIQFQLAVAQKILSFKMTFAGSDATALSTDWQASNNGSTWTTLSPSSFNIFANKTVVLVNAIIPDTGGQIMTTGDGAVYTHSGAEPTIAYLYYRILFSTNPSSPNTLSAGYITEMNFQVA